MVNMYVIQEHVLKILNAGLASSITYHKAEYAVDVAKQAIAIAQEEGITDEQTLLELQIAGLYHDTGFYLPIRDMKRKVVKLQKGDFPTSGSMKTQLRISVKLLWLPKCHRDQKTFCNK